MIANLKHITLTINFILCLPPLFAQINLEPPKGADGLPGSITSSFIIKWASVDSAIMYEYIVSNNPLCFSGCPGDTRQAKINDTTTTQYNLQEGLWYYWITRAYYQNGDTSSWSTIWSFLAKTPPAAEPDQLIKIAPNPVAQVITLEIDWGVNPAANKISMQLFDLNGQPMAYEMIIEKTGTNRYQTYTAPNIQLGQGIRIAKFIVDDNPNNSNNRIIKKFIVTQ